MQSMAPSPLQLTLCLVPMMAVLACTAGVSTTPQGSSAGTQATGIATRDNRAAEVKVSEYRASDDQGRPAPPVPVKLPVERTLHGHTLIDDYAWLEAKSSPAVIAYLEAENRYTERMTQHTEALQEALYQEMVGRIQETDLSVPYRKGGYYYYTRTEEGKEYSIYCRKRGSLEAEEEVLLDLNQLAEGHEYFRLGALEVSPDGRLMAYSVDTDGSERFTLRIKNLDTGELHPDVIEEISWSLAWGRDNRTLFYLTLDDTHRPYRLWRHRLGTEAAADEMLRQEDDGAFYMDIGESRSRDYLFLYLQSATTSEVHYLDARQPGGRFEVFAPRRPEVEYDVVHQGAYFYIRTNDGAKNFKLLRTPTQSPEPAPEQWEEVIPERPDVTLTGVGAFARHLVLEERRDGLRRLRVRSMAGDASPAEDHEIEFPEPIYTVWVGRNEEYDTQTLRLRYTSMVTPTSIFDYHMDERTRELRKQVEVEGGYDPSEYQSERIHATAADGTRIPLSLHYRKGLKLDGKNPTLIYGYGSYGFSTEPQFSSSRLSLLDRGFLYVIAHVRGGSEMGEAWHDDGKLMAKRKTFTDFIAAAEHLVEAGYTSPEHLALQGGSAGGLLVGAVVNQRPDLFAAAVAQVPFVDVMNTMLNPDLPLTVVEYEEWGNPNEPEAFEYMLSYSPYENVRAQHYPRMLITGGLNDPRVSYWEPAKWAAKLRELKTDEEPLLLKINMGAGHSGASGRYKSLEELAFSYAFLIDTIGGEAGTEAAGSPR